MLLHRSCAWSVRPGPRILFPGFGGQFQGQCSRTEGAAVLTVVLCWNFARREVMLSAVIQAGRALSHASEDRECWSLESRTLHTSPLRRLTPHTSGSLMS